MDAYRDGKTLSRLQINKTEKGSPLSPFNLIKRPAQSGVWRVTTGAAFSDFLVYPDALKFYKIEMKLGKLPTLSRHVYDEALGELARVWWLAAGAMAPDEAPDLIGPGGRD